MTDRITQEKRCWNMSRIKGKGKDIEIALRKDLFRRGLNGLGDELIMRIREFI